MLSLKKPKHSNKSILFTFTSNYCWLSVLSLSKKIEKYSIVFIDQQTSIRCLLLKAACDSVSPLLNAARNRVFKENIIAPHPKTGLALVARLIRCASHPSLRDRRSVPREFSSEHIKNRNPTRSNNNTLFISSTRSDREERTSRALRDHNTNAIRARRW